MAELLELIRDTAVPTELDLLNGATYGFRTEQWIPQVAIPHEGGIPDYVDEAMDLQVSRTNHDNLAASFQALDQMREWAAKYRHDLMSFYYPIYLRAKLDNESGSRQAFIKEIGGSWRSDAVGNAGLIAQNKARIQLKIKRHPLWEHVGTLPHGGANYNVSGAALRYDYTDVGAGAFPGDVRGDAGARIRNFTIRPGANNHDVGRIWIGIRTTRFGTDPDNLLILWEFEGAGVAGTDCSAPQADAMASPGAGNTKRVVSFATVADWALRYTFENASFTANYLDQLGRFLWLFRYKVDASTECEVKLKFGFEDLASGDFVEGPIREATNTDWDYLEMGESQVPPYTMHVLHPGDADNLLRKWQMQVWARRTSGTGSLHLDCICPIPIDEAWLIASGIGCTQETDHFRPMMTAEDRLLCLSYDTTRQMIAIPEFSCGNFYLPSGDGRMIIVYAEQAQSVLSNTLDIEGPTYIPRFYNLRGSS